VTGHAGRFIDPFEDIEMKSQAIQRVLAVAAALCVAATAHATTFTGDVIDGVRVIEKLDIDALEGGRKHRFYLRGIQMGTGQHWYVPVMVAKGVRPGKKVALVAGVHGDELSPVDAVQRTFAGLDPAQMSGAVLAVIGPSRASLEMSHRRWPTPTDGGISIDMNRVWPGKANGNIVERQAWIVWNNVFKGNTDLVLDHHTAATGGGFTFFIFADLTKPDNKRMAELFPVQQIKNDPGYPGTLETAFVKAGIPAITLELGGPRSYDKAAIRGTVEGNRNVLIHYGVIPGTIGRTSKEAGTFFGNKFVTTRAEVGGFAELLVGLGETVKAGQKVAIQRNAFGDVLREYTATVDGQVATVGSDAIRQPGHRLLQILTMAGPPECPGGVCPPEAEDDYEE
jgi:predicted deacylase